MSKLRDNQASVLMLNSGLNPQPAAAFRADSDSGSNFAPKAADDKRHRETN